MTEEELVQMKRKGDLTDEEFLKALSQLRGETRNEVRKVTPPDPEKIRKRVIFSIALLGIFSALTGLGLIIADNWDNIPDICKVAGGLLCLLVSLIATVGLRKKNKILWSEGFLFLSFLLVGANICLVHYTYDLGLSLREEAMLWWAFSFPMVFFTRYKLIPYCSVGLLVFSAWEIVWAMNYLLVAGILFLLMMLTHFANGPLAKITRDISFIGALACLYVGDIVSNTGAGAVGVITTTMFLMVALNTPKNNEGIVRYYNCLFLLVAWRIFLLFWGACYTMAGTSIGIMLLVFGTVLLIGAGLYTYFFKQIQNFIKGFVIKHEQE